MATFSTNQNRQLYVVNGKKANAVKTTVAALGDGAVMIKKDADNNLYLIQNGKGGLTRSDLICPKSIMWANATAPADTQIALKSKKVVLDEDPVAGQDYILRVTFRQAFTMSDEDFYIKDAAVHAVSTMDTAAFYNAMAASLFTNLKRLYSAPLEIANADGKVVAKVIKNGGTTVLKDAEGADVEFTDGIYINEKSQAKDWKLGTASYQTVLYEVTPTTITVDGEDVVWGTVTDETYGNSGNAKKFVDNGYNIADLEYFCMGERGDQYKNMMWPSNITTQYYAIPTSKYFTLDVHYAYQGTCEDVQKSEKTLTIVAEDKATIAQFISDWGITDIVKVTPKYTAATALT